MDYRLEPVVSLAKHAVGPYGLNVVSASLYLLHSQLVNLSYQAAQGGARCISHNEWEWSSCSMLLPVTNIDVWIDASVTIFSCLKS